MIPLADHRWGKLSHAFGKALDVPGRLQQLASAAPPPEAASMLRASLCHQLSVSDAAYAAAPHLVALAFKKPPVGRRHLIELVAHIEGCRQIAENYVAPMPADLEKEYFEAVRSLPGLIGECSHLEWDQSTAQAYAAALLIVKGHARLGMIVTELEPRTHCTACGAAFDYPY